MRKWRPPTAPHQDEWQVSHQIVVPSCYRSNILHLAHSLPLADHLGINKTYQRVLCIFIGLAYIQISVRYATLVTTW